METKRKYRLEQGLQIILRNELAETSDVYLTLIRIAVRALFSPLRVRDVHREPAALLHVGTIQLQRVLCRRLQTDKRAAEGAFGMTRTGEVYCT